MRTHPRPSRRRRTLATTLIQIAAAAAVVLGGLGGAAVLALSAGSPPAGAAVSAPAQGWTTTEAPLPADAGNGSTNPEVYPASSSCAVANACVTVGWYYDDGSPQHAWGLIEQQNGTSWTDTEAPQPSNAGSGTHQGFWFGSDDCGYNLPCRAVSCPAAGTCYAVGEYLDTAGYAEPVVDTLSNGTWTSSEAPVPSNTATDAGPVFPAALLYSISCPSVSSCVAVGRYRNASNDYVPLVDTLSGTTWTNTPVSFPSGAGPSVSDYPPALTGVSCASPSFCVAAGVFVDTAGKQNGLLEVLSNGTWTAQPAPLPADTGTDGDGNRDVLLAQIACPSTMSCTAVGFYARTNGFYSPLIESWNGSGWTATEAPLPAGAFSNEYPALGAVSCPTPGFCVAVGQYYQGAGELTGLIETWSGGTWTATRAPQPTNPPESDQFAILWEVACPTAGFCLVPGQYENASGTYVATVLTLSSGSWSVAAAPLPANSSGQSYGRTVACASPVACVLGGQYHDPGNEQVFLDTWTGLQGYWLSASDGGIFTYGNGQFYGSTGNIKLNQPVVGMAPTPDGQGYWFVASDGGVFNYGDAGFWGSAGSLKLNKPVVGMAATPDGKGYWLVASDGGIFTYGDAQFWGSAGNIRLNQPIVGMAATPDGGGYWLVASDGGIFSYGDALFYGSTGNIHLNKPVVGMAATPDGLGYWLVASDGGIFNYGDASFYGSTGNITLNKPVVGMAPSPSGKGYWLVASDGGIFNYGDAPFYGSAGNLVLNKPVVGMAG
jgi:hypothetical protein